MESSSSYTFGRRFKNRLFVGGLPANTTAQELAFFFSNFASVVEAKIIYDEHQISKGYGFITFHSEQDVKKVIEMGTLFFRNKKLNVGPAVRKEGPSSDAIRPELVVVQQQMKGDYYYPLFSQEQCGFQYPVQYSAIPTCALEVPYQLADRWTIPYNQPQPRHGYGFGYGFQPQVLQSEYKPRKTRIPPRFRKGRTNNKSTERAI